MSDGREVAENAAFDESNNAVSDLPEKKPEEDAQPDHEEKKEAEEEEDKVDLLPPSLLLPSISPAVHGDTINHVIAEKLQRSVHGITSIVDQVWVASKLN